MHMTARKPLVAWKWSTAAVVLSAATLLWTAVANLFVAPEKPQEERKIAVLDQPKSIVPLLLLVAKLLVRIAALQLLPSLLLQLLLQHVE